MGEIITIGNKAGVYKKILSNPLERTIIGLFLSSDSPLGQEQIMAAARTNIGPSLFDVYRSDISSAIENLFNKDTLRYTDAGLICLSREQRSQGMILNSELRRGLIQFTQDNYGRERNIQLFHAETSRSLYGAFAEYCNIYNLRPQHTRICDITPEMPILQYGYRDEHNEKLIIMLKGHDLHFLAHDNDGLRRIYTAWPMKSKEAAMGLFYRMPLEILEKTFTGREGDSIQLIYGLRAAVPKPMRVTYSGLDGFGTMNNRRN